LRTTSGWAKARVRRRPSGESAPWPALEITIIFEPGTFSMAVRIAM
jgi:hypothetical protein